MDLDYVHTHTRLLVRSLEWQKQRQDSSYLLRGTDLEDARQWLNQGINKEPRPTDIQIAYIHASLEAREAMLKARRRAKQTVVLTTVLANLTFVIGGLFLISNRMADIAVEQVEFTGFDASFEMEDEFPGHADELAELAQINLLPGQNEPINNSLYQRHQAWLQAINDTDSNARPITYLQAANADEVMVIGDLFRITNPENAYSFRQTLPITEEIREDFVSIHTLEGEIDATGAETGISIYGPIENDVGDPVGVLELRYDAKYLDTYDSHIQSVQDKFSEVTVIAFIIALIWFVISSLIILQATQPPHELLSSGDRSH
ncbi:MAG: hypothetical protein F6K19_40470 [Cyanothece sp. SIO1E1]|nr:hypothetical protein [Cyanothece sp. SIO1E1]